MQPSLFARVTSEGRLALRRLSCGARGGDEATRAAVEALFASLPEEFRLGLRNDDEVANDTPGSGWHHLRARKTGFALLWEVRVCV